MRVRTKQELCQAIAGRWGCFYLGESEIGDPRHKAVYQKLLGLNGNGTEAQIAEIIGNSLWTKNECFERGKDAQTVVLVGEEPDYDSKFTYLCAQCLKRALRLATSEGAKRRKSKGDKK